MKSTAMIEFTILFDPAESWTRVSELEIDFAAFLKTKGLQGQLVTPVGLTSKRVIQVTPIPQELNPVLNEPSKNPGQILNNMGKQKGFDGKFRKQNG